MSILDPYLNTPEIQQATTDYNTASNAVSQYAISSSNNNLPEQLRQAVLEKYNYNADLINQRNKAAADYFQTPSADRIKYANIGNPMMAEKLVAADRAIMYEPWANLTDILNQRMGSIDRAASSLADTASSQYEMAKYKVEAARQKLSDLMTYADLKAKYDTAGKTTTDKTKAATDKVSIDAWLSGVDGLPNMEGVRIPTDRQTALIEGQKLIARGFDPETVGDEIDAHFPFTSANDLESTLAKTLKEKIQNSSGSTAKSTNATSIGTSANIIYLQDPTTGQIYPYDGGYTDPDYIADQAKGWQPYFR